MLPVEITCEVLNLALSLGYMVRHGSVLSSDAGQLPVSHVIMRGGPLYPRTTQHTAESHSCPLTAVCCVAKLGCLLGSGFKAILDLGYF